MNKPIKLLIIVSGDYGELSHALYFIKGNRNSLDIEMMLPVDEYNRELDPNIAVKTYQSLSDIITNATLFQPDLVMLFSGYLLKASRHLSFVSTVRMICWLKRQHIEVVTSDPFIGLTKYHSEFSFYKILSALNQSMSPILIFFYSTMLKLRFFLVHRLFLNTIHIYPTLVESSILPQRRFYSYYNQAFFLANNHNPAHSSIWLFVISEIDLAIQKHCLGDEFFHALVRQIENAVKQNKKVVVIAPKFLVASLNEVFDNNSEISMMSDIKYVEYEAILQTADYAFFWNIFSFSLLTRVLAGKPTFFFSYGHMVDIMPRMLDEGIKLFYSNWHPPLLDIEQLIDGNDLKNMAADFNKQAEIIRAVLKQGNQPLEVIKEILLLPKQV